MPKSKKFKRLLKAAEKYYVGKEVPVKFQGKYGKVYDKEEARSVAYAIARKLGWRT